MNKEVFIIAGPNGAGKTTFAVNLIDQGWIEHYVNADEIAKEYRYLDQTTANLKASRQFLKILDQLENKGESFAFETTLSGLSYLKRIKRLQQNGWSVSLYYLMVSSPDISALRVEERVAHGGHDIPKSDIYRRFPKSLNNFYSKFLPVVDYAECIFNEESPYSVFKSYKGQIFEKDEGLFEYFLQLEALCRK
ncbi:MAG: zeta toxin family protein [Thiotrichales bacterium]|nr:zeta toxin family protein [Thiotrichales bacterium]